MERLTYRDKKGKAHIFCKQMCADAENCTDSYSVDLCQRFSAFRKLAELEDLEEQGRLLRLPCKVGDTVYVKMTASCKMRYVEAEVRDFTYFMSCGFCVVITSKHFDKQNIPFSEFGKTVFLSEAEAEAKLKEMEDSHD